MQTYKNEYTNGEITVRYQPRKCIHAETCAKGLSDVFRTTVLPWIDLDGADTKEVIAQVKKCPSGALSFEYNNEFAVVK
ncbi:MAG: (4Fe-4S)-binding protein [Marinirhabdus sp.]|nr:(4Fe-4S)-binding protein [Marinirhabdus sp.]